MGKLEDLGSLGGRAVEGLAINDAGEIVGDSALYPFGGEVHAFVYLDGPMLDLNNLIDPALGSTVGVLHEATGINDRGQIIVNGGDNRAYLLTPLATPVPEPCTLALCGLALLGPSLRRRIGQN